MIAIRTPSKKRVRLLALMVIGIASPLAFSPKTAIAANDAQCLPFTTCCVQQRSHCCWSPTQNCLEDNYDHGVGDCPQE